MRSCVAGLVVLAVAAGSHRARADAGAAVAVDADAPPVDEADDHAVVQAAVGAGSDAGAVALAELRAEWSGPAFAIALGGRLRWRDRELVRTDWDRVADWLGVIRRLEVAHHGDHVTGALGLGRLAPITEGGVVDGYAAAAIVDRHAPGAVARIRTAAVAVDAAVDDVTAPTLVAAGVEVAIGGRWRGALRGAVDPGTAVDTGTGPGAMTPASGMIELAARWIVGPAALSGGVIVGSHRARDGAAGASVPMAGAIRGEVAGAHGRLHASAMLEARVYAGATAAAPYGPLWPVEREQMADPDDRGVATAIAGRLALDGIGVIEAGLRGRGARGDLVTARLALPWWRYAQAGGYAAIGVHAAVVAAEARVVWSPHWFSGFEAGRGYRRDDAGVLVGVWQVAAWFGGALGW